MNIHSIELERFRSFRKRTRFEIPESGFVYVTGRNDYNPDMGANATGKSSLFESAYWCLYGKTSRNLKAGTVANWTDPKKCWVRLEVSAFGKRHEVLRQWNPNELTLDGKEVNQETLERELGLPSADLFLYSQFFSQFSPTFLDLTPERKLALLIDVMNLRIWDKASGIAAADVLELRDGVSEIRGRVKQLADQLESTKVSSLEKESKEWEAEHKRMLRDAKVKLDKIRLKQRDKADTKGKQEETLRQIGRLEKELASVRKSIAKLRDYLVINKAGREIVERSIDSIQRIGPVCPKCGQKVGTGHKKEYVNTLREEMEHKEKTATGLRKQLEDVGEVEKAIKQNLATLGETLSYLKQEQAEADVYKEVVDNFKARYESLRKEVNPYIKLIDEAKAERDALTFKRTMATKRMKRMNEKLTDSEFWIKGFKEVRLLVVQNTLAQLEVEVNQTVQAMGMEGWEIRFDVEKENKTGGVRRGFTTMILSPDNDDLVPWEAWSGGESQRLRFAAMMGFANLIHSVAGTQPNVEMWDEPSTWLSDVGIEQMLQELEARSRTHKRTIMLADHRALSYGGFTEQVVVTRDKSGSHI